MKGKRKLLTLDMSQNITECLYIGMTWEEIGVSPQAKAKYMRQLQEEAKKEEQSPEPFIMNLHNKRTHCVNKLMSDIGGVICFHKYGSKYRAYVENYFSFSYRHKEAKISAVASSKERAMQGLVKRLRGAKICKHNSRILYAVPENAGVCGICCGCKKINKDLTKKDLTNGR